MTEEDTNSTSKVKKGTYSSIDDDIKEEAVPFLIYDPSAKGKQNTEG